MPRCARIKKENSYYHIICRSITEIELFKDDSDKIFYLNCLQKAKLEYKFELLSYCLMDTHLHLLVNPLKADLSTIMRKINVSYAMYYNRKYQRHGPVFAGRFKSKIIMDTKHFITVSLYIHNNPKDIKSFLLTHIIHYKFSSLSYYLGITDDEFNIINKSIILNMIDSNYKTSTHSYYKIYLLYSKHDIHANSIDFLSVEEIEKIIKTYKNDFTKENGYVYQDDTVTKHSNLTPTDIIKATANYYNISSEMLLFLKYNRTYLDYKAVCCLLLKRLTNVTNAQICSIFGNISNGNVYDLCKRGYNILENELTIDKLTHNLVSSIA